VSIYEILIQPRSLDPTRLSGHLEIRHEEFLEFKGESFLTSGMTKCTLNSSGNFGDFLRNSRADFLPHASLFDFEKKISNFPAGFRDQKNRIACVLLIRRQHNAHYSESLAESIIKDGFPAKLGRKQSTSWLTQIPRLFSSGDSSDEIDLKKAVGQYAKGISDQEFLVSLSDYVNEDPLLEPATRSAFDLVHDHITSELGKIFGKFYQFVLGKQREVDRGKVAEQCKESQKEALRRSTDVLSEEINSISARNTPSYVLLSQSPDSGSLCMPFCRSPLIILKSLEIISDRYGGRLACRISTERLTFCPHRHFPRFRATTDAHNVDI
jgi:hypothetical protein